MPPVHRDGPQVGTEGHPDALNATTTLKITPSAVKGGRRASNRREAAVTCRVSLLVPSGRRTWWWFLGRCPLCGTPFLGRARQLEGVTRERHGQCGHRLVVVVARTYGRIDTGAAA
jgi:hypothetical protein